MSAIPDRKAVVFRMDEDRKMKLRLAAIKNHITVQDILGAFADEFIAAFDSSKTNSSDPKMLDTMKIFIKRARVLKGEGVV